MAAPITVSRKGTLQVFQSIQPLVAALLVKGQSHYCIPVHRFIHLSYFVQKDRTKDKILSQHLHYRDHEKTMRHRNLPLVELPDYSYADGRPTEIALGQKERQEKNFELARQVVKLIGEVKFAQEQHASQEAAKANRQQKKLDSRLKEKNHHT